jgi:uncharacterized RDD family membrane protein YckC/phage FluMu protein Com
MPVKVRCRSCQKVLNAPDRARGKAIKCPNCEEIVRVPSGDGKQPRRRKARKSSAPVEEHAIAGADLRHAEDTRIQVCPKCGAEVAEEDVDCPACGIDLATGEVSIRTLRSKGLAAEDPREFYSMAWNDSARFVLDNKKLVFRTGIYWTLLMLLLGGSLVMCIFFVVNYPPQADYRGLEKLFGRKYPLKILFGALAFLFWSGTLGWYWRLAIEVIQITLAKKKKKLPDVHFDFFEVLAFGCKVVFWPVIFLLPLIVVVAAVTVPILLSQGFQFDELITKIQNINNINDDTAQEILIPVGIAVGTIYGLCLLMYPVAMVHMSMPYTYRAWLPTETAKIWAKNIGPSLYWLMVFVVVNLPMIGILVGIGFLANQLGDFFQDTLRSWSTWILAQTWGSRLREGFIFQCVYVPLAILFAFLIVAPICLLAAVPAVFAMRANGLLAFYCKDNLELIREKNLHEKAGFWVRYLAFLIDMAATVLLLLTPVVIKSYKVFTVVGLYLGSVASFYFYYSGPEQLGMTAFFIYLGVSYPIVFGGFYYILSESSADQGTIGKQALGLVVLTEKRMKRLKPEQAGYRFFAKFLTGLPLGLGLVFSAFTPKKQALHDMMAKTVVVFKGDDDATI